ncbi:MAG: hypothetical protein HY708_03820 [Ignavibacteriae bacterium]|nr:hypothetical protein [Ignavibacteriota bacterium]
MEPFHFYTKLDLTILLGLQAKNVTELLECIQVAPESSVYHHTHRFLQQHHYLSPEPPNDFAYWITDVLNDPALGEKLSSVDVIQFSSLSDLRNRFVEIMESHLTNNARRPESPPGEEFHFMACQTFAFHTPYIATDLSEFKEMLTRVSINSLYYHVFDAKLRLERGENDFSRWFRDRGETALADELKRLDPYTYTLEGLRNKIMKLVDKYDKD